MNYLTDALKESMKAVLVDMAIDGKLDGDINQLDMDLIEEKAVKKLQKQKGYKELHAAECLSEYLGEYGDNLAFYNKLKKAQADGKGSESADDFVQMAEEYEWEYTVNDLLELVELPKTLNCPICKNHLTNYIEDSEEIRECEGCGAEWEESTGDITLDPREL